MMRHDMLLPLKRLSISVPFTRFQEGVADAKSYTA